VVKLLVLVAAASLIAWSPASAETRPLVVELFTSQGCSSCPPADALLGELARRPDVVALGYHVNYWDNLGWKDPFSSAAATDRQRLYAARFNGGRQYTPELVVDGTKDLVGSDREAVFAALDAARPAAVAPVAFAADRDAVTIGAGNGRGAVLLARFLRHRTTSVGAGENAHRVAEDTDAVETLTMLGDWQGTPIRFAVPPPRPDEGVAVLVQAEDGTILGAAATTPAAGGRATASDIPKGG
jgi:hypothetical protein